MCNTYYGCNNITGSPVCGNNVTNMSYTYYACSNLTGSPVCGNSVIDMSRAYVGCRSLTGSPVCGPNVTNMGVAYQDCRNLTGSPVCGDKVLDLGLTYYNCRNLTGSPVCGNSVSEMTNAYAFCINLTGSAACGPNVISMVNAYRDCVNLTTAVIGPKVVTTTNAYYNCKSITNIIVHRLTPCTISNNTFYGIPKTVPVYVHLPALNAFKTNSQWNSLGREILPMESLWIDTYTLINRTYLFNKEQNFAIQYIVIDESITPTFTVNSSNSDIVSVSNCSISSGTASFTLSTHNIMGSADITLNISDGNENISHTFTINTVENYTLTYSIENIVGNYTLNNAGYCEVT